MQFEEARMSAFHMNQGTHKNHCNNSKFQLKHLKTGACVNNCFLLIKIHTYSKTERSYISRHNTTAIY